jgi:hypothetical protein
MGNVACLGETIRNVYTTLPENMKGDQKVDGRIILKLIEFNSFRAETSEGLIVF